MIIDFTEKQNPYKEKEKELDCNINTFKSVDELMFSGINKTMVYRADSVRNKKRSMHILDNTYNFK